MEIKKRSSIKKTLGMKIQDFRLFPLVMLALVALALFSTRDLTQLTNYDIETVASPSNKIVPEPMKAFWEHMVYDASVVFQSSTNTDWCQNIDSLEPEKNVVLNRNRPARFHKEIEEKLPKVGMYLVKIPKTGSSTTAAVALQVAKTVAHEKGFLKPCPSHTHHGDDYKFRESPSFIWTMVREPHKRIVSQYFHFKISRQDYKYDSKDLAKLLKEEKNFQLNYLGAKRVGAPEPDSDAVPKVGDLKRAETIYNIFREYNFVGVMERMDESLVVMKLLFGFSDESIIVFSSKRAGGFDDGFFKAKCFKIQKSYTTPFIDKMVAPGSDYRRTNMDYYLYAVANASLDRTIDALGRDRVEREVARHLKLKKMAEDACYDDVIWPCSEGMHKKERNWESDKNCFFGDVGCGHECIIDFVRNANS